MTISHSAWTLSLAICLMAGACSSPATKACRRIASLCELELSREELSDCIESLDATSVVAPHVDTSALCGPESDRDKAFFSALSEAQRGDRRFETVKLFRSGLTSPPTECEITLSLSQGSTPPQHYCFKSGTTSPGKCS